MIKPPEKPVSRDFDKARDWVSQQESLLTHSQLHAFDKLKKAQKAERKGLQQKLDTYRLELERKAQQRRAITELAYHPPAKTKDPDLTRLIRKTLSTEKKLATLNQEHEQQCHTALKAFEEQRVSMKSKTSERMKDSWKRAVEKAIDQETDLERGNRLAQDFEKAR